MKHIKNFEKYNESLIITASFGLLAALGVIAKASDLVHSWKSESKYNEKWKKYETGEEEEFTLYDGTKLKIKKIVKENKNYYSIIDNDFSGNKKIFVLSETGLEKLKKNPSIQLLSVISDVEYFKVDFWGMNKKRNIKIPSF